jgi:hypothetical protein
MPDQTHAQPTAGNATRTLDPELLQRLIALGFDPEAPVYEGHDWFKQSTIIDALRDVHPGPVVMKFGGVNWDLPTDEEQPSGTKPTPEAVKRAAPATAASSRSSTSAAFSPI